jgi:microcystin-dependent protein
MSEPFIGEIKMVGFNFNPNGYLLCSGQILSIAQNTALFSLLGTTYGGNGQTTFALPDLRGRVPVHFGQGPGLNNYTQGQTGGLENTTLTVQNMPAHTHSFAVPAVAATANSNTVDPNHSLAIPNTEIEHYSDATPNTTMRPGNTSVAGGSLPFSIRDPYLVINFVIALQGLYPSRG